MVACALVGRTGKTDRAFLKWLEPIMSTYKGEYSELPMGEMIKGLLERTDEEIKAASQLFNEPTVLSV